MADLGTVLVSNGGANKRAGYIVPAFYTVLSIIHRQITPDRANNINQPHVPVAGVFSGSVREAGVAVPNCLVRVYQRINGRMITEVRTDGAGNFTVPGMRQGVNDHYVIALDPDGGALYNALIFDRVSPV